MNKDHIFRSIAIIAITASLISCKATNTAPEKTGDIGNFTEEVAINGFELSHEASSFKDAFEEMASFTESSVHETELSGKSVEWFNYESVGGDAFSSIVFYEIYPQLKQTCPGQLSPIHTLTPAFFEGLISPEAYGFSAGVAELLNDAPSKGWSEGYIRHNNPSEADFRGSVGPIFGFGKNVYGGLGVYVKELMGSANKKITKDNIFTCSVGGKFKEALFFGHNYYRKPESSEPPKQYVMYLNESTLTEFIKKEMNDAIKPLLQNQEASEMRRRESRTRDEKRTHERQDFLERQRKSLKELNELERTAYWEIREAMFALLSQPGKKICSYKGNKMGFVEEVSGKKVKVLWKGRILDQPDGFFFGQKQFSIMSDKVIGEYDFRYDDSLTDMTWVDSDTVSVCNHVL